MLHTRSYAVKFFLNKTARRITIIRSILPPLFSRPWLFVAWGWGWVGTIEWSRPHTQTNRCPNVLKPILLIPVKIAPYPPADRREIETWQTVGRHGTPGSQRRWLRLTTRRSANAYLMLYECARRWSNTEPLWILVLLIVWEALACPTRWLSWQAIIK